MYQHIFFSYPTRRFCIAVQSMTHTLISYTWQHPDCNKTLPSPSGIVPHLRWRIWQMATQQLLVFHIHQVSWVCILQLLSLKSDGLVFVFSNLTDKWYCDLIRLNWNLCSNYHTSIYVWYKEETVQLRKLVHDMQSCKYTDNKITLRQIVLITFNLYFAKYIRANSIFHRFS